MNKLEKAMGKLSETALEEIEAMDTAHLQAMIADSEEAMEQARNERDANPQYQAAKQAVSDLSLGLKEVNAYQKAKITVALHNLRAKGAV